MLLFSLLINNQSFSWWIIWFIKCQTISQLQNACYSFPDHKFSHFTTSFYDKHLMINYLNLHFLLSLKTLISLLRYFFFTCTFDLFRLPLSCTVHWLYLSQWQLDEGNTCMSSGVRLGEAENVTGCYVCAFVFIKVTPHCCRRFLRADAEAGMLENR